MAKLSIRRGIFETNSSSTHVLTIQKENVLENPESMVARFRNHISGNNTTCLYQINAQSFGWEHRVYHDFQDKMAYLLIAIDALRKGAIDNDVKKIKSWLKELNIELSLPEHICEEKEYEYDGNKHKYLDHGWYESTLGNGNKWCSYIDHTEDLGPFVHYVMEDKNHFFNFMFGVKSYIETGNDNDETFDWWYHNDYRSFDDMWEHYKKWWVNEGDDEKQVYEEMKKEYPDSSFHVVNDDVVEFYKGN